MKQIEYINNELCSQCTNCCKYHNRLVEASFHNRQTNDWFEEAFEKYGVYPLRDPLIEVGEYCEFYDASIGCLIPREKRSFICRTHVCDKLLLNYKEANEIDIPDNLKENRPNKHILNEDKTKILYSYDVDHEKIKQLMEYRLQICKSCDSYVEKDEIPLCKLQCCGLVHKTATIYSLDENGKAIQGIIHNGSYTYVCRLKKW